MVEDGLEVVAAGPEAWDPLHPAIRRATRLRLPAL
jgi:hypothetical protein